MNIVLFEMPINVSRHLKLIRNHFELNCINMHAVARQMSTEMIGGIIAKNGNGWFTSRSNTWHSEMNMKKKVNDEVLRRHWQWSHDAKATMCGRGRSGILRTGSQWPSPNRPSLNEFVTLSNHVAACRRTRRPESITIFFVISSASNLAV